ncbi:phospholipid transport system substrate-binding protein [Humitalea rosea]|uniref:Phospholipid transport system substrate-binding protein n=1 Tax=Humitalea rosea TaxID=990373 RepID=A0A2W7JB40_9PROT|nr:ABC transporter substrate-binding protein [Humitalea rosea]PZW48738.1 phospholipid transport system substrate-binding protein [Humitalea rosea]
MTLKDDNDLVTGPGAPAMMPRRRFWLLPLGLGLALVAPGARAQVDPSRAGEFIRKTGEELVAAINAQAPIGERREQVAAVLRRAVDLDGVGRFILGRWWRIATSDEQQQYQRLFEEMLIRNLSSRFGEYQGVRFTLGRVQARAEDDVLVSTIVERPNSAPFGLDWRVGEVNGQPRVVDVIAEGTSLRLTQRSEYSSVITRNSGKVAPLLDAMRGQIATLAAAEGR